MLEPKSKNQKQEPKARTKKQEPNNKNQITRTKTKKQEPKARATRTNSHNYQEQAPKSRNQNSINKFRTPAIRHPQPAIRPSEILISSHYLCRKFYSMPELSVVIPIMNEEDNVQPMVEAVENALKDFDYELIFVDDGSSDETKPRLKKLLNDRIKLVELRKNYGQSTAMTAGIDFCKGKYITMLDGDLQNDPADIPMMLEKLVREEWDVVAGNRANRKDGMFLRKIPSKIANALIRRWTGVYIKDYGCTLKVFRAEIAQDLGLYGELHRFIPVLAAMQGARITQVDVRHHARRFGKSKYGIGRTVRVMSDLITMVFFRKYIQKPMHFFGGLGFLSLALGMIINIYLLGLKIAGHDIGGKPMLILGMVLLLGGIQLITIGIVAEISIRNYFEGTGKKTYQVRNVFGGQA